jgi:hypothetical protein
VNTDPPRQPNSLPSVCVAVYEALPGLEVGPAASAANRHRVSNVDREVPELLIAVVVGNAPEKVEVICDDLSQEKTNEEAGTEK